MEKNSNLKLPAVGMRMIKTLISVTLVLLAYGLADRNPCFACIGAVYGMGSEFAEGRRNGGNRLIGTMLGGAVAIPFYYLYHNAPLGIPGVVYATAGLFLILYISTLFGAGGSIQPGTVVFYVVIFTVAESHYLSYTVARVIDTGLGVALSLLISRLWVSPKDKAKLLQAKIAEEQREIQESIAAMEQYESELEALVGVGVGVGETDN